MYENKQQQQTAVLAAVDTGEYDVQRSVDELEELAKSAGAEVLGRMIQRKDRPDPATLMGAGRLEELADFVRSSEAELVIFDHELAPAQQKNIEKVVDVPVIDRTTLILDIFAQRAKTSAGRLQVELAQLKYRLPRLSGLGTACLDWAAASEPAALARASWKATAGISADASMRWSRSWRLWKSTATCCGSAGKRTTSSRWRLSDTPTSANRLCSIL